MEALQQTCVAMVFSPPITGASSLVRKIPSNRHFLSCYFLPTVPTGRGPRYAVEHLQVLGVKASSQREEMTGSALRASISASRSFPNTRMMEDKYLTTRARCLSKASDTQEDATWPASEASVTECGSGVQDSSLQSAFTDSGPQIDAQNSSFSSEADHEGASAIDSVATIDTEFETSNGPQSAEEESVIVNHNEAIGSSLVSSQSISNDDTIETEETNGNPSKEHPWKFWTTFLSQLQQQGYYPAAAESVGEVNSDYSIIKRAILNFGRDRDDIYE